MNLIPVFGMLVNTKNIKLSDEHQAFKWLKIEAAKDKLLWNQQKNGISNFHSLLQKPNCKKSEILEIKF